MMHRRSYRRSCRSPLVHAALAFSLIIGLPGIAQALSTGKANVAFSIYAAAGTRGQTVVLKTLVYSGGEPATGLSIDFSVDGSPVGSAVSDETGAALSYKIPISAAYGLHSVTAAFAGDGNHNAASRTNSALTVRAPVAFSIYPAAGAVGDTVTLKTLVFSGGAPVSGLPVTFRVEGNLVGTAISGAADAEISYVIPAALGAGVHKVTVSFPGNYSYIAASSTVAALTVKASVGFSIFATTGAIGDTVTLKTLVYSGGAPVSGLPIAFYIEGKLIGRVLSSATDARISYAIPASLGVGSHAVTVAFPGNGTYAVAWRTTVALTVKPGKSGVAFSISPATGAIGDTVTLKTLVSSGGAAVSGLTIAFSVDGIAVNTAVSDSTGASVPFVIPAVIAAGPHAVTVSFAGNSSYFASTRTTLALTVKATGSGTVTGRWEWTSLSGYDAGVWGALLTQNGTTVTGTVIQETLASGQFTNGVATGSFYNQRGDLCEFIMTLAANSQTVFGTLTTHRGSGDVVLPQVWVKKSDVPVNPDTSTPTITTISPADGATGVARTNLPIVVTWSKPVHGYDIKLSGPIGGIMMTGIADEVIDGSKSTYDTATNTYTMYLRSAITLDPLATYTLTMDSTTADGDYADWPDWRDPYGVPAWTTAADIVSVTFTTGP